jgi:DnaJ-domain-containing protein 1
LRNVHPLLHPLQHQAAAHLLSQWGVDHLPRLLATLLEQHDLEFALVNFFGRLGGASLAVLLNPAHADHPDTWHRVDAALALLLRIEQEARTSRLDAAPLYASLSGSIERAKALFNLYQQANTIQRLVETTEVSFPLYLSFREDVLKSLVAWHCLSPADLAEAFNVLRDYVELQRMFEGVTSELDEAFAWLGKREAELAEELRAVVLRMAKEKEELAAAILSGRRRPDEGVGLLYALWEKLKVVADHAGYASDSGSTGSGSKRDEELRLEYSARLGVPPDATFREIKAAYRRLVKKYYPGADRGDIAATEKFIQITEAYKWLLGTATSETKETI